MSWKKEGKEALFTALFIKHNKTFSLILRIRDLERVTARHSGLFNRAKIESFASLAPHCHYHRENERRFRARRRKRNRGRSYSC